MKNKNGMTMVEVLISMLIILIVAVSGISFCVKAFALNYRVSDFALAYDKSSSMVEEMQIYAISSDDDKPNQVVPNGFLDWRIELIEKGWLVHISAICDRIEVVPGIATQQPALVQLFCFTMWPVEQAKAFRIYESEHIRMFNLDDGGRGNIASSCMTEFNDLNTDDDMTAIRLKTAYARFAYEIR